MTDPIADLLIRIKNGYQARKTEVSAPYSKLKKELCQILVDQGYLVKFEVEGEKVSQKQLNLVLRYKGKQPVVTNIKRISHPSLRVYAKSGQIPLVRYGFGITIVSTPKGLKTNQQAKEENLGGEVIAQIW